MMHRSIFSSIFGVLQSDGCTRCRKKRRQRGGVRQRSVTFPECNILCSQWHCSLLFPILLGRERVLSHSEQEEECNDDQVRNGTVVRRENITFLQRFDSRHRDGQLGLWRRVSVPILF